MILVPSYWPYSKSLEGTAQAYPGHFPTLKTLPDFPEPTLGLQTGSGRLSYRKALSSWWSKSWLPSVCFLFLLESRRQPLHQGVLLDQISNEAALELFSWQKVEIQASPVTKRQLCESKWKHCHSVFLECHSLALAIRPLTNGLKLFPP